MASRVGLACLQVLQETCLSRENVHGQWCRAECSGPEPTAKYLGICQGKPREGENCCSVRGKRWTFCLARQLCALFPLEPQSCFGDKLLKFQVVRPQNGTAVLKLWIYWYLIPGFNFNGKNVTTTNTRYTCTAPGPLPVLCTY